MSTPLLPGVSLEGYIERLGHLQKLRQRNRTFLAMQESQYSTADIIQICRQEDSEFPLHPRRSNLIPIYTGLLFTVCRIPERGLGQGQYVVATESEEIGGEWFTLDGARSWRTALERRINRNTQSK